MKKYRNFKCKQCGVFDKLVDDHTHNVKCECGKRAKRVASAAKYFNNTTGKSPSL